VDRLLRVTIKAMYKRVISPKLPKNLAQARKLLLLLQKETMKKVINRSLVLANIKVGDLRV